MVSPPVINDFLPDGPGKAMLLNKLASSPAQEQQKQVYILNLTQLSHREISCACSCGFRTRDRQNDFNCPSLHRGLFGVVANA